MGSVLSCWATESQPSDSAVRGLHGTLEIEAGEGGGKCSGTVRTSEAMEKGFDLPVLQPRERAEQGNSPGDNQETKGGREPHSAT